MVLDLVEVMVVETSVKNGKVGGGGNCSGGEFDGGGGGDGVLVGYINCNCDGGFWW